MVGYGEMIICDEVPHTEARNNSITRKYFC